MTQTIEWDEAVISNFVGFVDGEYKTIVVSDWELYKTDKFGETKPAIKLRVLEENGEKIKNPEYCWDTTSQPVIRALQPILENKDKNTSVKLKVLRTGDRNDTRYKIEELK